MLCPVLSFLLRPSCADVSSWLPRLFLLPRPRSHARAARDAYGTGDLWVVYGAPAEGFLPSFLTPSGRSYVASLEGGRGPGGGGGGRGGGGSPHVANADCLSVCLPACLFACLSVGLSVCLTVSVCLPACLPAYLRACLRACLPVCVSVCNVYLSVVSVCLSLPRSLAACVVLLGQRAVHYILSGDEDTPPPLPACMRVCAYVHSCFCFHVFLLRNPPPLPLAHTCNLWYVLYSL